jgi:hypothetical protein
MELTPGDVVVLVLAVGVSIALVVAVIVADDFDDVGPRVFDLAQLVAVGIFARAARPPRPPQEPQP